MRGRWQLDVVATPHLEVCKCVQDQVQLGPTVGHLESSAAAILNNVDNGHFFKHVIELAVQLCIMVCCAQ